MKKRRLKKNVKIAIIAFGVMLLLLPTSIYGLNMFKKEPILVPDFANKTEKNVIQWVEANEIDEKLVDIQHAFDEEIEKDYVISQSITAGKELHSDDVLVVVISDGIDMDLEIELPDFSKMKESEIKQWFIDNKFNHVSYKYEETDKEGVKDKDFLRVEPKKDKLARKNKITVVFAKVEKSEEEEVAGFPNVQGYSEGNLKAWAEENGVILEISYEFSETYAQGQVISTSASIGDEIHAGDHIAVVISKGSKNDETYVPEESTYIPNDYYEEKPYVYNEQTPIEIPTNSSSTGNNHSSTTTPVADPAPAPVVEPTQPVVANDACPDVIAGLNIYSSYRNANEMSGALSAMYPGCIFTFYELAGENNPNNISGIYQYAKTSGNTMNVTVYRQE